MTLLAGRLAGRLPAIRWPFAGRRDSQPV